MKVIIGHAVCSENGDKYGKPGDQTGKELRLQEWYLRDKGWKAVFRWKDTKLAEKSADYVSKCCQSSKVGYSQASGDEGRESLDKQMALVDYCIEKLECDVNCDCSSLIASAVRSVGGKVDRGMYTGNEEEQLNKSGLFKELKDIKYTDQPDNLKVGDILWGDGHTAMVVCVSDEVTQKPSGSNSSNSNKETEFTKDCSLARELVNEAANEFEQALEITGIADSDEMNSVLSLITKKLKAKHDIVHEVDCKNYYVRMRNMFNVYKDMTSDKMNIEHVSPGIYTIVAESSDGLRGKLKSGAGWVSLSDTEKL